MTKSLAQRYLCLAGLPRRGGKVFIKAAPYAKSSPDYLDDDFFYEYLDCLDAHFFRDYQGEEGQELAEELAAEAAKARQELFKDARNWPLPYLVASATYKILSARDEGVYMITYAWRDCFFWLFLCFDEPLFECPSERLGKDLQERDARRVSIST